MPLTFRRTARLGRARVNVADFLLARFVDDDDADGFEPRRWQMVGRVVMIRTAPDWLLRHMAAHRADHPDYREEWRP